MSLQPKYQLHESEQDEGGNTSQTVTTTKRPDSFESSSPPLRNTLRLLEEKGLMPSDQRATRCIVELSNAIEPFLQTGSDDDIINTACVLGKFHPQPSIGLVRSHSRERISGWKSPPQDGVKVGIKLFLTETQQANIHAALNRALVHIARLEEGSITYSRVTDLSAGTDGLPAWQIVQEEKEQLHRHIDGLERQLGHLRAEKEKMQAAGKAVASQQLRDNTSLRTNLAQARKESDAAKNVLREKEASLQSLLSQLVFSQEEAKRLKHQFQLAECSLAHTRLHNRLSSSSPAPFTQGMGGNGDLAGTTTAPYHVSAGAVHPLSSTSKSLDLDLKIQEHSKYGIDATLSLQAANDVMRQELHKEQSGRAKDKAALSSALDEATAKAVFEEAVAGECRLQMGREKERREEAERERELLKGEQQNLVVSMGEREAKVRELEYEVQIQTERTDRLREEMEDMIEVGDKEKSLLTSRTFDLTECVAQMRIGIIEAQGELAAQSIVSGDSALRASRENDRIAERLDILVAEYEELRKHSQQQDSYLQSSGNLISSLTQRMTDESRSPSPSKARQKKLDAEKENTEEVERREEEFRTQLLEVEKEHKEELESKNLDIQALRNMVEEAQARAAQKEAEAQLGQDEVRALRSEFLNDAEATSSQIEQMGARILRMGEENAHLTRKLKAIDDFEYSSDDVEGEEEMGEEGMKEEGGVRRGVGEAKAKANALTRKGRVGVMGDSCSDDSSHSAPVCRGSSVGNRGAGAGGGGDRPSVGDTSSKSTIKKQQEIAQKEQRRGSIAAEGREGGSASKFRAGPQKGRNRYAIQHGEDEEEEGEREGEGEGEGRTEGRVSESISKVSAIIEAIRRTAAQPPSPPSHSNPASSAGTVDRTRDRDRQSLLDSVEELSEEMRVLRQQLQDRPGTTSSSITGTYQTSRLASPRVGEESELLMAKMQIAALKDQLETQTVDSEHRASQRGIGASEGGEDEGQKGGRGNGEGVVKEGGRGRNGRLLGELSEGEDNVCDERGLGKGVSRRGSVTSLVRDGDSQSMRGSMRGRINEEEDDDDEEEEKKKRERRGSVAALRESQSRRRNVGGGGSSHAPQNGMADRLKGGEEGGVRQSRRGSVRSSSYPRGVSDFEEDGDEGSVLGGGPAKQAESVREGRYLSVGTDGEVSGEEEGMLCGRGGSLRDEGKSSSRRGSVTSLVRDGDSQSMRGSVRGRINEEEDDDDEEEEKMKRERERRGSVAALRASQSRRGNVRGAINDNEKEKPARMTGRDDKHQAGLMQSQAYFSDDEGEGVEQGSPPGMKRSPGRSSILGQFSDEDLGPGTGRGGGSRGGVKGVKEDPRISDMLAYEDEDRGSGEEGGRGRNSDRESRRGTETVSWWGETSTVSEKDREKRKEKEGQDRKGRNLANNEDENRGSGGGNGVDEGAREGDGGRSGRRDGGRGNEGYRGAEADSRGSRGGVNADEEDMRSSSDASDRDSGKQSKRDGKAGKKTDQNVDQYRRSGGSKDKYDGRNDRSESESEAEERKDSRSGGKDRRRRSVLGNEDETSDVGGRRGSSMDEGQSQGQGRRGSSMDEGQSQGQDQGQGQGRRGSSMDEGQSQGQDQGQGQGRRGSSMDEGQSQGQGQGQGRRGSSMDEGQSQGQGQGQGRRGSSMDEGQSQGQGQGQGRRGSSMDEGQSQGQGQGQGQGRRGSSMDEGQSQGQGQGRSSMDEGQSQGQGRRGSSMDEGQSQGQGQGRRGSSMDEGQSQGQGQGQGRRGSSMDEGQSQGQGQVRGRRGSSMDEGQNQGQGQGQGQGRRGSSMDEGQSQGQDQGQGRRGSSMDEGQSQGQDQGQGQGRRGSSMDEGQSQGQGQGQGRRGSSMDEGQGQGQGQGRRGSSTEGGRSHDFVDASSSHVMFPDDSGDDSYCSDRRGGRVTGRWNEAGDTQKVSDGRLSTSHSMGGSNGRVEGDGKVDKKPLKGGNWAVEAVKDQDGVAVSGRQGGASRRGSMGGTDAGSRGDERGTGGDVRVSRGSADGDAHSSHGKERGGSGDGSRGILEGMGDDGDGDGDDSYDHRHMPTSRGKDGMDSRRGDTGQSVRSTGLDRNRHSDSDSNLDIAYDNDNDDNGGTDRGRGGRGAGGAVKGSPQGRYSDSRSGEQSDRSQTNMSQSSFHGDQSTREGREGGVGDKGGKGRDDSRVMSGAESGYSSQSGALNGAGWGAGGGNSGEAGNRGERGEKRSSVTGSIVAFTGTERNGDDRGRGDKREGREGGGRGDGREGREGEGRGDGRFNAEDIMSVGHDRSIQDRFHGGGRGGSGDVRGRYEASGDKEGAMRGDRNDPRSIVDSFDGEHRNPRRLGGDGGGGQVQFTGSNVQSSVSRSESNPHGNGGGNEWGGGGGGRADSGMSGDRRDERSLSSASAISSDRNGRVKGSDDRGVGGRDGSSPVRGPDYDNAYGRSNERVVGRRSNGGVQSVGVGGDAGFYEDKELKGRGEGGGRIDSRERKRGAASGSSSPTQCVRDGGGDIEKWGGDVQSVNQSHDSYDDRFGEGRGGRDGERASSNTGDQKSPSGRPNVRREGGGVGTEGSGQGSPDWSGNRPSVYGSVYGGGSGRNERGGEGDGRSSSDLFVGEYSKGGKGEGRGAGKNGDVRGKPEARSSSFGLLDDYQDKRDSATGGRAGGGEGSRSRNGTSSVYGLRDSDVSRGELERGGGGGSWRDSDEGPVDGTGEGGKGREGVRGGHDSVGDARGGVRSPLQGASNSPSDGHNARMPGDRTRGDSPRGRARGSDGAIQRSMGETASLDLGYGLSDCRTGRVKDVGSISSYNREDGGREGEHRGGGGRDSVTGVSASRSGSDGQYNLDGLRGGRGDWRDKPSQAGEGEGGRRGGGGVDGSHRSDELSRGERSGEWLAGPSDSSVLGHQGGSDGAGRGAGAGRSNPLSYSNIDSQQGSQWGQGQQGREAQTSRDGRDLQGTAGGGYGGGGAARESGQGEGRGQRGGVVQSSREEQAARGVGRHRGQALSSDDYSERLLVLSEQLAREQDKVKKFKEMFQAQALAQTGSGPGSGVKQIQSIGAAEAADLDYLRAVYERKLASQEVKVKEQQERCTDKEGQLAVLEEEIKEREGTMREKEHELQQREDKLTKKAAADKITLATINQHKEKEKVLEEKVEEVEDRCAALQAKCDNQESEFRSERKCFRDQLAAITKELSGLRREAEDKEEERSVQQEEGQARLEEVRREQAESYERELSALADTYNKHKLQAGSAHRKDLDTLSSRLREVEERERRQQAQLRTAALADAVREDQRQDEAEERGRAQEVKYEQHLESVKGQYEAQINRLQMQLNALHSQMQDREATARNVGSGFLGFTGDRASASPFQSGSASGLGLGATGCMTGGMNVGGDREREREKEREGLEQRILRAEARSIALTQQMQSMPSCLQVAQAEKRVSEARLQKALTASDARLRDQVYAAEAAKKELTAFLEISAVEKKKLLEKIEQRNNTIHQLTHHLHSLQSAEHVRAQEGGSRDALLTAEVSLELSRMDPAPWDARSMGDRTDRMSLNLNKDGAGIGGLNSSASHPDSAFARTLSSTLTPYRPDPLVVPSYPANGDFWDRDRQAQPFSPLPTRSDAYNGGIDERREGQGGGGDFFREQYREDGVGSLGAPHRSSSSPRSRALNARIDAPFRRSTGDMMHQSESEEEGEAEGGQERYRGQGVSGRSPATLSGQSNGRTVIPPWQSSFPPPAYPTRRGEGHRGDLRSRESEGRPGSAHRGGRDRDRGDERGRQIGRDTQPLDYLNDVTSHSSLPSEQSLLTADTLTINARQQEKASERVEVQRQGQWEGEYTDGGRAQRKKETDKGQPIGKGGSYGY